MNPTYELVTQVNNKHLGIKSSIDVVEASNRYLNLSFQKWHVGSSYVYILIAFHRNRNVQKSTFSKFDEIKKNITLCVH